MENKSKKTVLNNYGYLLSSSGKLVHRTIWEEWYGRPIPEGCVIHHINGDKTDNRIHNLICVPRSVHTKFHTNHMSESTLEKYSEVKTKKYARIVKAGKTRHNKQRYTIKQDAKQIKTSTSPSKLMRWFLETYPDKILVLYEDKDEDVMIQ